MFKIHHSEESATIAPKKKEKHIVSIVEQVSQITIPRNRAAFVIGAIVGAFVPVAVFALAGHVMGEHHNPVTAWNESTENRYLLVMIAAGCLFSAKSVFGWGLSAFAGDRFKALGYVALIEGAMIFSPFLWLRILAGCYLLAINAIATGANLMERSTSPTTARKPRPQSKPKPKTAHHKRNARPVAKAQATRAARVVHAPASKEERLKAVLDAIQTAPTKRAAAEIVGVTPRHFRRLELEALALA